MLNSYYSEGCFNYLRENEFLLTGGLIYYEPIIKNALY